MTTNSKLYLLLAFYGKEVTTNKGKAVISGIRTYRRNSDTTLSHEDNDSTMSLSFIGGSATYKLSEIEITPSPEDHTDLQITIKQ